MQKIVTKGSLLIVLLVLVICSIAVVHSNPEINKISLIKDDVEIVDTVVLNQGVEIEQQIYMYKDFDYIVVKRSNIEKENQIHLQICHDDIIVDEEDVHFHTGEMNQEIFIRGGVQGSYIVSIRNTGYDSIVLPYVSNLNYDIEYYLKSETPLLNLGVYKESNEVAITFYIAIAVIFLLSAFFLITSKLSPLKCAICVFVIGCVYLLIFPAWNINDFDSHFFTAYSYSNDLIGEGNNGEILQVREDDNYCYRYVFKDKNQAFYQPSRRSYSDAIDLLFKKSDQNSMVPIGEWVRILRKDYGFWNYIPYIIGITISRMFSFNLVTAVLISRIVGLLLYTAGIYLAFKRIKRNSYIPIMIISLIPTVVMNSVAISYDPLCYIVTIHFLISVFSMREIYTIKNAVVLGVSCFLLGIVKGGAYVYFGLLLGLIGRKKNKVQRLVLLCSIFALMIGVLINYHDVLFGNRTFFQFGVDSEKTYTIGWAASNPFEYIVLMVRTYLQQSDIVYSLIGRNLGWNAPVIPHIVCGMFFFLILVTALNEDQMGSEWHTHRIIGRDYIWITLTILASILLTPLMLLSNTSITMNIINGVQGRYYLPLLLLTIALCQYSLKSRIKVNLSYSKAIYSTLTLTIVALYYMGSTFLTR